MPSPLPGFLLIEIIERFFYFHTIFPFHDLSEQNSFAPAYSFLLPALDFFCRSLWRHHLPVLQN